MTELLTSVNQTRVTQHSLPFGAPLLMTLRLGNVQLLYQQNYVTAYDLDQKRPLWVSTSYSVSRSVIQTGGGQNGCSIEDPRVPSPEDVCSVEDGLIGRN